MSRGMRVFGVLSALAFAAALLQGALAVGPAVTPLALGGSVPATLTVSGATTCSAEFSVDLAKGQTLEVVAHLASGLTSPTISFWAANGSPAGKLTVTSFPDGPRSYTAYLLAPADGAYSMRLTSAGAPSTCTVSAQIADPLSDRAMLDPMHHVTAGKLSRISAEYFGVVDQIENPVTFVFERWARRRWNAFSTVASVAETQDAGSSRTTYVGHMTLPKGTFRVRLLFTSGLHPAGVFRDQETIISDEMALTELPPGTGPRTALSWYLNAVEHKDWLTAFALLPPAQQRLYGSPDAFGEQVGSYDISGHKIGPSKRHGAKVTIVALQRTPAMYITYTWTYLKLNGTWYVKSRKIGGTL